MDVETWLAIAQADADRRNLPELKAILQGLAAATRQLREAPWNDEAGRPRPEPPPGQLK